MVKFTHKHNISKMSAAGAAGAKAVAATATKAKSPFRLLTKVDTNRKRCVLGACVRAVFGNTFCDAITRRRRPRDVCLSLTHAQ